MGKTLDVSNLGDGMAHGTLEQMFGPYGTVRSARVIMDWDTGLSKGFGFVEMSSAGEAQAANAALNRKEVDGRALTVNEARPREGGGGGTAATASAVFSTGLLMGFFGLMLRPGPTCTRSGSVPAPPPNLRDTPGPLTAGAACGESATGMVDTSVHAWSAGTRRFSPAWVMSYPPGCKPCATSRRRTPSTDASVASSRSGLDGVFRRSSNPSSRAWVPLWPQLAHGARYLRSSSLTAPIKSREVWHEQAWPAC